MKSTDEVKVGAVTLGGFVILALMLTFLGVFSFASRQYKLNVIFDNVNGLKVGNEVRFAGVPIGKVDDILVDGSKVKVVMKIDQKQKVPVIPSLALAWTASWEPSLLPLPLRRLLRVSPSGKGRQSRGKQREVLISS